MKESGLTEIIPLVCTSGIWGQHPVLSHPEFPQGARWRASCFYPEFPGAHRPGGCNVMVWWLQHPLFTDMASNIFHSHNNTVINCVNYLDCAYGFKVCAYGFCHSAAKKKKSKKSKLIKLHTLNICCLLFANYTPLNLKNNIVKKLSSD